MMREAQRRIAGRNGCPAVLISSSTSACGADVHVYPDVPSTAGGADPLRAPRSRRIEIGRLRRGRSKGLSPFFVVRDYQREVERLSTPTASSSIRGGPDGGCHRVVDRDGSLPSRSLGFRLPNGLPWLTRSFYHLPTTDPNADLARFYFHRWLPDRQGRSAWGQRDSPRCRAGRLARGGQAVLGADLPDPSTFVHLAAS